MADASGVNWHLHLTWLCLLLVVPINDHMDSCTPCTSDKEHWMDRCKNSDFLTHATLAQAAIWSVHSLANFLRWTGRCCLYPQGSRDYKVSSKVRERYHCKTRWSWDWNLLVDCRCNACLWDYSDTHPGGADGLISREPSTLHELRTSVMCTIGSAVFGVKQETLGTLFLCFSTLGGGDLVSCILPMQDITFRRFTDPHTSLGVGSEHPC